MKKLKFSLGIMVFLYKLKCWNSKSNLTFALDIEAVKGYIFCLDKMIMQGHFVDCPPFIIPNINWIVAG